MTLWLRSPFAHAAERPLIIDWVNKTSKLTKFGWPSSCLETFYEAVHFTCVYCTSNKVSIVLVNLPVYRSWFNTKAKTLLVSMHKNVHCSSLTVINSVIERGTELGTLALNQWVTKFEHIWIRRRKGPRSCPVIPVRCWRTTKTHCRDSGGELEAVSGVLTLFKSWCKQHSLQPLKCKMQIWLWQHL